MRIHSDTIMSGDIHRALDDARRSYPPMDEVWIDTLTPLGSRSRQRAWEIKLAGIAAPGRRRRRNNRGLDEPGVVAATWDECGMFLRNLFETDPDMYVSGSYRNREDFHARTSGLFVPHPWELEHPINCGGCVLSDAAPEMISDAS